MQPKRDSRQYDLSLLARDSGREALLERMRGKLAAPSQAALAREEKARKAVRRGRLAWGWRIGLVVLFLAANAALVGFKDEIGVAVRKQRTAPRLAGPESLTVNDQALYWAYALYDFNRLKAAYGAPENAVIDAAAARRNLEALLPEVDVPTRVAIEKYRPRPRSRA
jgi:hypothetical protein